MSKSLCEDHGMASGMLRIRAQLTGGEAALRMQDLAHCTVFHSTPESYQTGTSSHHPSKLYETL